MPTRSPHSIQCLPEHLNHLHNADTPAPYDQSIATCTRCRQPLCLALFEDAENSYYAIGCLPCNDFHVYLERE